MNPATRGTEGSASVPVLYMALELGNRRCQVEDQPRSSIRKDLGIGFPD